LTYNDKRNRPEPKKLIDRSSPIVAPSKRGKKRKKCKKLSRMGRNMPPSLKHQSHPNVKIGSSQSIDSRERQQKRTGKKKKSTQRQKTPPQQL